MSPQVLPRGTTCLNLDILQSVIEFVNKRSDVHTLSLLSSRVHPMAIRRLLRMGPIKLQNEALVRGFHVFLSADPASRGPHVRTLDIWTECIQEVPNRRELECLICDILAWSRNLHGLFLGSYGVSHCPGQESPLQAAFEGLKTLRELSVCGREDYAPDILLKKIRSPIRVLRFDMHNLRGWRCTPSRINTYIAHLIPTLQILELGGTLETEPASLMAGYLFPCSSVSSLTIRRLDLTVDLSILVRWLPALKCLEVGGLQAATQWTEPEDYHRARLRNKHRQRDCSWARLRRLSCNIPETLYVLGLTCPLHRVALNSCHIWSKPLIVTALSDNPPAELYLSIELSDGLDVLEKLFPPEAGGTLTHLTMCLHYVDLGILSLATRLQMRSGIIWVRTTKLFHAQNSSLIQPPQKVISTAIRHLSLTHLRIVLHCDIRRPSGEYRSIDFTGTQHLIQSVRDVDLREVATTLSCGISTLQYILVTSSGYTAEDDPIQFNVWHGREEWLRSGGWRLFKDSHRGMRRMEELDDRLAMSLIAREEMGLSETDQVGSCHCCGVVPQRTLIASLSPRRT